MAGQTYQEKDVLFFDRLTSLHFVRSNGLINQRGGDEGGVKIRIHQGNRGAFISCHFGSLNVLSANIRRAVKTVSADGLTLSIFLIDSANGRSLYQRLFHLSFFDEMASKAFFDTYSGALPYDVALKAASFEDLQQDQIDAQNCVRVVGEDHHHDDWDDSNNGGEEGDDGQGCEGRNADSGEEVDEDQHDDADGGPDNLLDDFDVFGESQDLYNPLRPLKFN